MEVKSSYRYARISAFKVREVTREIQGMPVTDALNILRFTPKKAATLVNKTLKSAVANAENNNNLRVDDLTVLEAVAGEGPTLKRIIPKAKGSAGPIRKRMSHIFITLTDAVEIKRREDKKKTKKKSAPKAKAATRTVKSSPAAAEGAEEKTPVLETAIPVAENTPETPAAVESTETVDTPLTGEAEASKESTENKS
jgi:large subunit ribosomal protein L22